MPLIESSMTSITSPLRYPGGKARALKRIMPLIPKGCSEYREPFLGGASVFIAFRQENPNAVCKINDLNTDVYCFWKTLQEKPEDLVRAIVRIKKDCRNGKELYLKLAKSNPSGIFGRALRFYILNRITYSGIADSGGYSAESFEKRFTSSKIEGLLSLSKLLKNVKITNESYERILLEKGKDVFVFLDPPYWQARNSPLYGKNGDMNKFFDHEQLAENVKMCKHTWLITCDASDRMRSLFSFTPYIYPWEMKYNGMHKKKAIEGKELFIANYEIENLEKTADKDCM
jgi:DNA adenine methylase